MGTFDIQNMPVITGCKVQLLQKSGCKFKDLMESWWSGLLHAHPILIKFDSNQWLVAVLDQRSPTLFLYWVNSTEIVYKSATFLFICHEKFVIYLWYIFILNDQVCVKYGTPTVIINTKWINIQGAMQSEPIYASTAWSGYLWFMHKISSF